MKLLTRINPEGLSEKDVAGFEKRLAARAVVFDDGGEVALLHVSNRGYHKLPGGGVEEGEDIKRALERECEEEIGCDIEIGEELGRVIEYRKNFNQVQESFCYVARVVGDKYDPSLTDLEKEEGFEVEWRTLEKAVERLKSDNPKDYMGTFVVERDIRILEEVRSSA